MHKPKEYALAWFLFTYTMNDETIDHRAHGVVASHPLRMRKALGSNPSVSICAVERCELRVKRQQLYEKKASL